LQKIDILQKRVTEHLADMKRLERDNQKNKKRGDTLQKEKDQARTELSKSVTLREKLEKLCRELQRENNRLKVRLIVGADLHTEVLMSWLERQQDFARLRESESHCLGRQIQTASVAITGLSGHQGPSASASCQYRGRRTVCSQLPTLVYKS
jgi:hypothetical protein